MTKIYFPLGSFPLLSTSVGEGEEPLHGPAVSRGATTKPAISKNPNDTKHSKWHNLDQGWANPCPSNQLILAIRPASISISISTMLMMMLMPSCNAVRDQILLGRRGTRQITKSHLGKYCSTLSFSLLRAISLGSANIVQQPLVITRWSLLPLPPDPNIVPLLCSILLGGFTFTKYCLPSPPAPPPQPGKCHTYEPAESYLKWDQSLFRRPLNLSRPNWFWWHP